MIVLEHVEKRHGLARVVKDLSMTVPTGEVTVLLGPSGCGKTTTLKMINGLVPLSSGRITVGGEDLATTDTVALRRRIGYIIQEGGLFPHYTVFDNVAVVPRLLGWHEERVRKRVLELVALLNLGDELLSRFPHHLSGGQQQRVGVARALAGDPEYLLMDEPFGAIDPINRTHIQDEFLRIQQQLRKTVVMVTHDLDEALKLGDRIAILHEGELIQYDRPAALLCAPANAFVARFLGGDRALRALRRHRVAEVMRRSFPLVTMNGTAPSPAEIRAVLDGHGLPMALLVDAGGSYRGYLTSADLRDRSASGMPRQDLEPVSPEDELPEAVARLLLGGLQALPVVADGRPVGMLTAGDLIKLQPKEVRGNA